MDPLSGVASFVTIIEALQGVYKRLARYAKIFVNAFSEIALLVDEVFSFSQMLLYIDETLEASPDAVLASIRALDLENHHRARAQGFVTDLKGLLSHLQPLKQYRNAGTLRRWFHGAAVRSKWVATKSKAAVLLVSLMSSTHSLNLLINTANLQTSKLVLKKLMSNQSSAEKVALLEKKIEVLNNQVRDEKFKTMTIRRECERILRQQNVDTASISEVLQGTDLTIEMASDEISHEGASQERQRPEPFYQQSSYTTFKDEWSTDSQTDSTITWWSSTSESRSPSPQPQTRSPRRGATIVSSARGVPTSDPEPLRQFDSNPKPSNPSTRTTAEHKILGGEWIYDTNAAPDSRSQQRAKGPGSG